MQVKDQNYVITFRARGTKDRDGVISTQEPGPPGGTEAWRWKHLPVEAGATKRGSHTSISCWFFPLAEPYKKLVDKGAWEM